MTIPAIQHIQVAVPPGGEAAGRRFYGHLLGVRVVEKPEHLRQRSVAWFDTVSLLLQLGVEPAFRPSTKPLPCRPRCAPLRLSLRCTSKVARGRIALRAGGEAPGYVRAATPLHTRVVLRGRL